MNDGGGLRVSVVGLGSGRPRTVTEAPTSAFHWSPDGSHLLLMTQEEGRAAAHRWMVWDGESTSRIGLAFLPSPTFLAGVRPVLRPVRAVDDAVVSRGDVVRVPRADRDRAASGSRTSDSQEAEFVVEGGRVVSWSPAPT